MPEVPILAEDARIAAARSHWQYRGQARPPFAEATEPGEESVWDFPRPPLIEDVREELRVELRGELIAKSARGKRVIETAGAPTYYFPPEDILVPLEKGSGRSLCEWKGLAEPLDFTNFQGVAWRYVEMFPAFRDLYLWVAFYPTRLECYIGSERVTPQPGGYYGGWVTKDLKGPIKGEPGSGGW
ncbi:MAG: DUF427 domain-containing protein [Pseudomonadales bacterium]|nr:DUF427 domain-containing protein [Pseudomonadales bacterium]MBO6597437.1 DUF427 domain-containing protein [Pseudomonadales bacterium]MBO6658067.1 DUF427 domain-containing protein [Pseudomonadales bacterium]MBO6703068.1 DUF427 domain-containing protein [Pseudomonadales bacterium]MBO6824171.1 DUF427 domain-containing protein [Pseudomonadales bacterium]